VSIAKQEDKAELIDLWVRCEMNPGDLTEDLLTRKWIDIGFQAEDPTTDFRASGALGLINLLHFLRNYEGDALECLKTAKTPGSEYFFACGGIGITVNLLEKISAFELYSEFENSKDNDDVLYRFNRIYSVVFPQFNRHWKESGRSDNFMNFNTVLVK
jgi:hypothetical protein